MEGLDAVLAGSRGLLVRLWDQGKPLWEVTLKMGLEKRRGWGV